MHIGVGVMVGKDGKGGISLWFTKRDLGPALFPTLTGRYDH